MKRSSYWLITAILHSLCIYSWLPYRFQLFLGKLLGRFLMRAAPKMVKITKKNIELCFPDLTDAQQKQFIKHNFESLGIGFFECLLAGFGTQKKLNKLHNTISGLENFEKIKAEHKGVILLFPHIVSMYLVGRLLLNETKMPFALMYHSPKHAALNDFMYKYLQRYSDSVFTRKNSRPMIRYLREGGVVWYAPDLDLGNEMSLFVPFFGVPAATLSATLRLAEMGDAKLVPIGFGRRADKKGYEIVIHAPLENIPSGNDLQDLTIINQTMEKIIGKVPEQYLWQYKRFNTRPDGKKIYV